MTEPACHLPIGYYLLHFETVLREVRTRYEDLLHPEERSRMAAFLALPVDARRLYVRLLTRKGPWFREDDLGYGEIGDVPAAAQTLCHAGFCSDQATVQELLPLLVRADLIACLERFQIPFTKTLRREALVQCLLEGADDTALIEALHCQLRPLRPLQTELWSLLCFLFFGNGEQDLSSFVLADLGRIRYETYALDPGNRLFQARSDLDFLLSLRALRLAFEQTAERAVMTTLTDQVLAMAPHPGVRQQRRYQRFLNDLGRAWERRGEGERALACYARSHLPPARERIVRLTADPSLACEEAIRMGESPLDASEERFARVFLKRHARRVPGAAQWLRENPAPASLPELPLSLARQSDLELAALEAARALGWDGFFAENHLWNALFGLVFWEELFAPVPGAFQHRFQSAPLDLSHPEFFARRREAMEGRLQEIQDREGLIRRVLDTATRKWGVANAFLAWRRLTPEMLAAAVERVPPAVLVPVLRTLARSPRAFSSGFPDLFLFRPQAPGWALWEVKGPGDTLRPEQERWLQQFQQLGAEVRVARVKWL